MHDKLFDYALIAFLVLVIAAAGFNLWLLYALKRCMARQERRAAKLLRPQGEHPADIYRRMREDSLIREVLNFSFTMDDIDPVIFDRLLYGTTFIDTSTGERVDPADVKARWDTPALPEYVEKLLADNNLELHPFQRELLAKFFDEHPDGEFTIDVNNVHTSKLRSRNEVPSTTCEFCNFDARGDSGLLFRHYATEHRFEMLAELEKGLSKGGLMTTLAPEIDKHLPTQRREPPLACCPNPSHSELVPLISTLAFPKYEFYCLECGCKVTFMGLIAGEPTEELQAKHDALRAEWDEHAGTKLITPNAWRGTCPKCFEHPDERNPHGRTDSTHDMHASDEEWAADAEAREWLKERQHV